MEQFDKASKDAISEFRAGLTVISEQVHALDSKAAKNLAQQRIQEAMMWIEFAVQEDQVSRQKRA